MIGLVRFGRRTVILSAWVCYVIIRTNQQPLTRENKLHPVCNCIVRFTVKPTNEKAKKRHRGGSTRLTEEKLLKC